ncbi:membrane dipeptidase, partial [Klebsiella pneumoniae]|uniref:membrane dipeptidase n=1 Tax=Klebsiella pneumoniae TaxID=573 RepID=UPI0027300CC8
DNRVRQLAAKGGVIQVNAYSDYLIPLKQNPERNKAMAALGARFHNLAALSPEQVKDLYQERDTINERFAQPKADLDVFMKHLLHLLDVAEPAPILIAPAEKPP